MSIDPNAVQQRILVLDVFEDSDSESDDDDRLSSVVAATAIRIVCPTMKDDISGLLKKRAFIGDGDSSRTTEKVRRMEVAKNSQTKVQDAVGPILDRSDLYFKKSEEESLNSDKKHTIRSKA